MITDSMVFFKPSLSTERYTPNLFTEYLNVTFLVKYSIAMSILYYKQKEHSNFRQQGASPQQRQLYVCGQDQTCISCGTSLRAPSAESASILLCSCCNLMLFILLLLFLLFFLLLFLISFSCSCSCFLLGPFPPLEYSLPPLSSSWVCQHLVLLLAADKKQV